MSDQTEHQDLYIRSVECNRLMDSHKRMQMAADAAGLGIFEWHLSTNKTYWENQSMYEIFGLSKRSAPIDKDELINNYLHPDDKKSFEQALKKAVADKSPFSTSCRIIRRNDGELRWLKINGEIEYENEKPKRIVGIIQDITDQKTREIEVFERSGTEEQLHNSEAMMDAIANLVPDLLWQSDPDGYTNWYNQQWLDYTGLSFERSLGYGWHEAIHPDDRSAAISRFKEAITSGTPLRLEYRIRRHDGAYRWFVANAKPLKDNHDKIVRWYGAATDIHELKLAHQTIRESEGKYRLLFESIDEGFCIVKLIFDEQHQPVDYIFEEINPAFERQTGIKDGKGKRMREIAPDHEQHWFDIYGKVAVTGESIRFQNKAAQLQRYYDVFAFPLPPSGEKLVGILFNDISERKKWEETLKEADQHKDEFLATLAHELRNPLTPIKGALDLLKDNEKFSNKAREIIDRQVSKLIHLIDDLMDISRITRNKIRLRNRRVNLTEAVEVALESTEAMMKAEGHEFFVHLPDQPLYVYGDLNRIIQVIINLLSNAAKYTNPGGRISLSVGEEDNKAIILVKDNGIGIVKEQQERIFEKFRQSGYRKGEQNTGLGIGLSLVKRLVTMHHGKVSVSSAGKGQGSEFVVSLPLMDNAPDSAQDIPDHLAEVDVSSKGLHVLVLDDNEDIADILETSLQKKDFVVKKAYSGQEALDALSEFAPNAALLDIGLPDMDGYQIARKLRQKYPDMLLIAHSGWGQQEDRRKSRDAGFDHHLVKPASLQEIVGLLHSAHQ